MYDIDLGLVSAVISEKHNMTVHWLIRTWPMILDPNISGFVQGKEGLDIKLPQTEYECIPIVAKISG